MLRLILITLLLTSFQANSQNVKKKEIDNIVFTPDGYYFSKDDIAISNYTLQWLSIFTLNANSNTASLRLQKQGKWIDISSKDFEISKDSSFFHFTDKRIGKVSITGRFTGAKGPQYDNIEALETVVFKGSITVNRKKSFIDMTWWEGD
ncbi:MAG: hypothetical protein JWP69_1484 [Flaviaesturariibacter sp.]|nr:hypothetical protein [Flaviaesturariibacter sp.]